MKTRLAMGLLPALLCVAIALAQKPDPASLLRQAAAFEAARKWDQAATLYSNAADALMDAGRMAEASAAMKKVAAMYESHAQELMKAPAQPQQPQQPQPQQQPAPAPATNAPFPKGQEFPNARQCIAGAAVHVAPGPGAPNGGIGRIAAASNPTDLMCTVSVSGANQRIIYWRLADASGNAKSVPQVTLPAGAEFKSTADCVAGRAVTVGPNQPYDDGGQGIIVKAQDNLTCIVSMAQTGKQNYVVYWRMAPQGAVARHPDHVPNGKYGCVTFAGIVSLNSNTAGRVEPRPLFDVNVISPDSYIGADGVRGIFSYDKTRGDVLFVGGSHNGRTATFRDNGGRGMFVFKGENGSIDCGL